MVIPEGPAGHQEYRLYIKDEHGNLKYKNLVDVVILINVLISDFRLLYH